jgi:hypothetical protein
MGNVPNHIHRLTTWQSLQTHKPIHGCRPVTIPSIHATVTFLACISKLKMIDVWYYCVIELLHNAEFKT